MRGLGKNLNWRRLDQNLGRLRDCTDMLGYTTQDLVLILYGVLIHIPTLPGCSRCSGWLWNVHYPCWLLASGDISCICINR